MRQRITIILYLVIFAPVVIAQETAESENKVNFSIGADLVSRYVWRGMALSTAPGIQPTMELCAGNFTFGTWGSYSFNHEDLQEVDLYISYSFKNITLSLNDYYNPVDTLSASDYFKYSDASTRHSVEGMVTIDGPESFPIQFVAGTFIYGCDQDELGKHYYSTYFELNYTFSLGEVELNPFVGATPNTGMYNDNGFGVVNTGISATRAIPVSGNYEIPIGASLSLDPTHKNIYLVFNLTF